MLQFQQVATIRRANYKGTCNKTITRPVLHQLCFLITANLRRPASKTVTKPDATAQHRNQAKATPSPQSFVGKLETLVLLDCSQVTTCAATHHTLYQLEPTPAAFLTPTRWAGIKCTHHHVKKVRNTT